MMMDSFNIQVGDGYSLRKVIRKEDAALNYGNGKVDNLLATPSMVALMMEAACKLLDEKIPSGCVSVALKADVIHTNPTLMGSVVTVDIRVRDITGHKVDMDFVVSDEAGEIGKGTHERVVVERDKLMRKARERALSYLEIN